MLRILRPTARQLHATRSAFAPSTNLVGKNAASSRVEAPSSGWRAAITSAIPTGGAASFRVLREKATEPRDVTRALGGWDDHYESGSYVCAGCLAAGSISPLYRSKHKFDCGCGWPGFWSNVEHAVREEADGDGLRCEVLCDACDGHLGHVFRNEGFSNPEPNERHCVNGAAIAFISHGDKEEDHTVNQILAIGNLPAAAKQLGLPPSWGLPVMPSYGGPTYSASGRTEY